MGAMVLLMQHTKIVNWAYNAVDLCMYVNNVTSDLNIIDKICVCQCLCLCTFHHVILVQTIGLCVCRTARLNI